MSHDAPTAPTAPTPVTPTPVDLAALRADLIAAEHRLAGRDDYAVKDPAYLDPFLERALAEITPGRLPATAQERTDVVARAGAALNVELSRQPGLGRIEALVADRYAHPLVTRDGDTVDVDVGVVAGPLGVARGATFLLTSPNVEANEWKSTEAARVLAEAAAAHPDAKHIRVVALMPSRADEKETWTYVYDRAGDRVRVFVPGRRDRVYTTDPLGGDLGPYLRGERSLSYWKLAQEPTRW